MSRWILGTFYFDFFFFVIPGIVTIFLLPQLIEDSSLGLGIGAFFITGLLDAGHVYTTIWRTWLDSEERRRYKEYLWVPLITFVVIVGWISLGIPFLWVALAYFTIFHNYRQFFGFTKWYEKLNQRRCRFSGFMVQAVCLLPFLLFHFRSGVAMGYMTDKDLLVTPMPEVLKIGLYIYGILLVAWIALEFDLIFRQKILEPNRFLSILIPAILYGHGFLRGHIFVDIVYPLLVAHAISYFAAMSLSLERLKPQKYSFLSALKLILLTAGFFGTLDYFYESMNVVPDANYLKANFPLGSAVIIGVFLTPLICHYVFDAWLWRHSHPNAKVVFTEPQPL